MTKLEAQLVETIHACWRAQKLKEGWVPGDVFDAEERVHDGLVPFDAVPRGDKLAILRYVRAHDVPQHLADMARIDRGPAREFLVEEVSVGMPVAIAGTDGQPSERVGHIVDWRTDADGELAEVDVRWSDGTTSTNFPFTGELARVVDG